MILDKTTILLDGLPITANVKVVNARFQLPARFNVPFHFSVEDTLSGSCTFELQESDSETGPWTDVAGSEFTLTGTAIQKGKGKAPYKTIPNTVTKQWLRLAISGTTVTSGKVLCALTREFGDEEYTAGQYINKGQVEG